MSNVLGRLGSLYFGAGRTHVEQQQQAEQDCNLERDQLASDTENEDIEEADIESEDRDDSFIFNWRLLMQHTGYAPQKHQCLLSSSQSLVTALTQQQW